MNNRENTKRIAKNTAMLYFRMLLIMAVTLYTSRVVLNTLGVEDFGIFNVVGGIVTMFAFLNSAMSSATQRFLSFELGKQNQVELKRVFSMSVNIHAIIAIAVLILSETIGLWFLNNQLVIPHDRLIAANWVYQFSILSFIVTIISVPYNATIIARERMNVFAYISIIEVSLKLLIVFMLNWFGFDKLKLYAVLIFLVTFITKLIYYIYCRKNYHESKYFFFWDKKLYKTLMSYAGWNLWGNIAAVMFGQGVNILLNIFFGPIVNAARGVSFQVRNAVNGFVLNFQTAMNPQIIKSYASDNHSFMHQLIFQGAKYSYYLLLILSLPIIFEAEIILKLWLKIVPEYTVIFTRLVLINVLIDSISGPLKTAAQASGKINVYQSVVGGLLILILPISYVFLKLGFPPEVTIYISIVVSIIAFIARLIIVKPLVNLSIRKFIQTVLAPIVKVTFISLIIPFATKTFIPVGYTQTITVIISALFSIAIAIYFFGLTKKEQSFMKNKLRGFLKRSKA